MMKLNIYSFFFISLSSFIYAQVGIVATPLPNFQPHSSALLHLEVSNLPANKKKGFLMPRVSLQGTQDTSTIPNPVTGLWVYNIQTTTGTNAVQENNIYTWLGSSWQRYYDRSELTTFLKPNNYYLRSTTAQTLSGTTLSNFNSGTAIPVNWTSADVVIANASQVELISSTPTEFQINKTGVYDIAGFFGYHPQFSSGSSNTSNIVITLQLNTGSGWQNLTAVTKVFESLAGDTFQSVSFPSNTAPLTQGDRIRFVISKNVGNSHGTNAGISSPTGAATKSIRISYLSEF